MHGEHPCTGIPCEPPPPPKLLLHRVILALGCPCTTPEPGSLTDPPPPNLLLHGGGATLYQHWDPPPPQHQHPSLSPPPKVVLHGGASLHQGTPPCTPPAPGFLIDTPPQKNASAWGGGPIPAPEDYTHPPRILNWDPHPAPPRHPPMHSPAGGWSPPPNSSEARAEHQNPGVKPSPRTHRGAVAQGRGLRPLGPPPPGEGPGVRSNPPHPLSAPPPRYGHVIASQCQTGPDATTASITHDPSTRVP